MVIRILHYVSQEDSMVAEYVNMLVGNMGLEAENTVVTEEVTAVERLMSTHYHILHIHGCWFHSAAKVLKVAIKQGTRMVLSPYGQLEPWIINKKYWKEKLPKRLLYQQQIVESAYVVIIQGKMEEECLKQLKWNPRMEIIRNPIITHSTTPSETARKVFTVYRRIMDSDPLSLMTNETKTILRQLLKAGITGDHRWVEVKDRVSSKEQWRQLICYAHLEQIDSIMNRGIYILDYNVPDIDVEKIQAFMPAHYEKAKSIQEIIGLQFASENDRLMTTFRQIRKLLSRQQLCICHLCELDKELREHDCDEDLLGEELKETHLYKTARRLMQLMRDYTGLDEGFMLLSPLNDRITKRIKRQINNHLRI